jgi:hypothetical protein
MPRILAAAIFAISLLSSNPGFTQSVSPATSAPPVRDPQAVATVQRSIAAMGGSAAATISNVQVLGTLAPTPGSYVTAGNFTWLDVFSGPTFEFRHELQTATVTRVQVSGHGSPAVQQGAAVTALRPHATYSALPYHFPVALLVRELANANYSIQMGGSVSVEGKPATQVILTSATDPVDRALSEQRWDFDPATLLPVRIEYRLASTGYIPSSIPGAVELSNYKMVNGVAAPFQLTVFENGKATSVATISSLAFNVNAPASACDLSIGGAQ